MAQIFVSHSKYDKEIRNSFDTVFARTDVKSVCMEFEKIRPPAWQRIKKEINASDAVFLLLGSNIRASAHTQNWIAFEVGLACAFYKEVWVFEQAGSYVEFPIPYLTDYLIYNLEVQNHFDYVRNIIEAYKTPLILRGRKLPHGLPIKCAYANCGSAYLLHTDDQNFNCPSCRQPLTRSEFRHDV